MTLPEATTGIKEIDFGVGDNPVRDLGSEGYQTTGIVRPRLMSPEAMESFSATSLTSAASSAADTVKQTLTGAYDTVSSAASNAWNSITGKGSDNGVAINATLPEVKITGSSPAPSGGSFTWLWVLLAAGGAYLVYHFTAGKKGGKSMFKSRASGSVVKFRGK